jgi:hypothetical protein
VLETLTYDTFLPLVGTTFNVDFNGRTAPLQLTRVGKVMESQAARLQRQPFSLFFTGPGEPFLPQQIHTFSHETLGTFGMFITAIGRDADGFQYEAVFA